MAVKKSKKNKALKSDVKSKKAPKSEKKALKSEKAPKAKAKATKKPRDWSTMVKAGDLSEKAKKLIDKADKLEESIAVAEVDLMTALLDIVNEVGGSSFEHPKRGPVSVMTRNEKTYWRKKPPGAERKKG